MRHFQLFKTPLQALLFAGTIALVLSEMIFLFAPNRMVLEFSHTQTSIGPKSEEVTANFNAEYTLPFPMVRALRFRANNGQWKNLNKRSPRLGRGLLLMEVQADELLRNENSLEVELRSLLGMRRRINHPFHYQDEMPDFPIVSDWELDEPEAQDGFWEVIQSDALGYSIRPRIGYEGYDRFVLIAPPFQGSRRITVDMRFIKATGDLFGFGVLPFWGGHLDSKDQFPRRGWEYGIAWYYSVKGGFGAEFSRKPGSLPHATDRTYQPFQPRPGDAFRIVVEARDDSGLKTIRFKIQPLPTGDFGDWIELTDLSGHMKSARHAVGLIAHRAQVEFGQATVEMIKDDATQK